MTDPVKFNKKLQDWDVLLEQGLDADSIDKILKHAEKSFNEMFGPENVEVLPTSK